MAQPRRMSLLQRFFYVAQNGNKRLDAWLDKHMIGLPDPPLTEEERQEQERNKIVDLSTLTLADHIRFAREAWEEYKSTFRDDYEHKDFIGDGGKKLEESLKEQREKAEQHLETHHPELKQQLTTFSTEVKSTIEETKAQVQVHVDEMKTQAKNIDVERIPEHVADAVNAVRNRPMVEVKNELEEWAIDKLTVGRLTLEAFVDGYKLGKDEEINRETPLLKELADRATERHKDFIEEKRKELFEKVSELEVKTRSKGHDQ
ncbi:hypothetical protein LEN26_018294 [Aphanomyces euteiches]|nr:hypothetical protein LEN26_018294 [Aphanomyces euteiches]KAH9114992.1 hypothetical protein AeMF1_010911 [Aphanomyces euteiches]KAH9195891.1 hypothetical protein AeNC1_002159 [Aphanomyces euteiches]